MSNPALTTKLYVPQPGSKVIQRPQLIKRLNEGLQTKLILISAAAGSGKSTLISEWVAACHNSVAEITPLVTMLSLDEEDSDLNRFLTYLVFALQKFPLSGIERVGKEVLNLLQTPNPPPAESIITTLINEIAQVDKSSDHFVLVLDDYHVIEDKSVEQAVSFLLEHLPQQMQLVIVTREDPALPLARLRARGQLTELRAADLRFTSSEAAEFLNKIMNLQLSENDITALESRTEGWIAGLQLAALSMQGNPDVTSFIQSFTGSHHFITDYLVEEVLEQQSEKIQTFLLRTSILGRLCGSLCDAVMDDAVLHEINSPESESGSENVPALVQGSGQKTLEYLAHANMFIIPLDNERKWYRYHHLFAELLTQRLQQSIDTTSDGNISLKEFHNRASQWYQTNGFDTEAFHHAISAPNFERAATLIELAWPKMEANFQTAKWLGWVKQIPDELARKKPMLSFQYAQALMSMGELEAAESRLLDAERGLDIKKGMNNIPPGVLSDPMVVDDEEQFRDLPGKIAIARAGYAQLRGDIPATLKYAKRALEIIPEEDYLSHGIAGGISGLAYWAGGDLESAYESMLEVKKNWQKSGNIIFEIVMGFGLAEIRISQGRLNDALNIYKHSLKLASDHEMSEISNIANIYLGLGMIYHEQGFHDVAAQNLRKSKGLGENTTLVDWPYLWHIAKAQILAGHASQNDLEYSLELLEEAKHLYVRNPAPNLRPVDALKANVHIKQGRLTHVMHWIRNRGLAFDDDLTYINEFEHLTLAKALIAVYQKQDEHTNNENTKEHEDTQAMQLLDRLLKSAEEGKRPGSMIQILIQQALGYQSQGKTSQALASLERAMVVAEPEGYVQIFVNEGFPIAKLLKSMNASRKGGSHHLKEYIHKLLIAFGKQSETNFVYSTLVQPLNETEQDQGGQFLPKSKPESKPKTKSKLIIEPLSKREIEILKLIAEGLSNQEICERLFIALNTVKGHNQNIFDKLGVQRRTEAVSVATELGLLSSS